MSQQGAEDRHTISDDKSIKNSNKPDDKEQANTKPNKKPKVKKRNGNKDRNPNDEFLREISPQNRGAYEGTTPPPPKSIFSSLCPEA